MESLEKNTLVQKASSPDEDSEEYKILAEELAILATELETKCIEVQSFKENFVKLESDLSERTSELERVSSQCQKAKLDGNTAVEKLKKTEDDLAQIKEKNAQLSDELLKKSRQVTNYLFAFLKIIIIIIIIGCLLTQVNKKYHKQHNPKKFVSVVVC